MSPYRISHRVSPLRRWIDLRGVFRLGLLLVLGSGEWADTSVVYAQLVEELPEALRGLDVEEHVDRQLPLELTFRNQNGAYVQLSDFCDGQRPVILSLNYSNCPMLCNLQLTGLVNALKEMKWTAGREFQVVSVSVDPLETIERAAQTQQRYLSEYGRQGAGQGWSFLVGKQQEIQKLAEAMGVKYRYLRDRREYSHPAVFVLCTPDGRISRYVYGIEFPIRTLELALTEAGEGQVGSAWDRILLYCLHYDSKTGQYTAAIWKIMRLAGVMTLLGLTGLIGNLAWQERTRRRKASGSAISTELLSAEAVVNKTVTQERELLQVGR